MKELKYLELQEIDLQEIISYSRVQSSPTITILDDLNFGLFNQVVVWADTLKLIFFIVKDTRKVAFVGNRIIALKIAQVLQVKAQAMYYSSLQPKKLLGKIYAPKGNDNYVVQAFNESGKPIEPFIDTNVKAVNCDTLSKYNFRNFSYAMRFKGSENNEIKNLESINNLRKAFLKNGSI